MRTSIILPSRGRAAQAALCCQRARATARGYDLEIIGIADDDAATATALAAVCDRVLTTDSRRGPVAAWNLGAADASGDVLVLGADDLWWFHGWLGETLEVMARFPAGGGMVGFNDLAQNGDELATHFAVSWRFALDHFGGCLVTPLYQHYGIDNEATQRAQRAGRYVWAQNAVVEHRHPLWRKARWDATYIARQALYAADMALFVERQAAGFPNDFAPVLREGVG